jgi:hypothetical protein
MKTNKAWHAAHRMPPKATREQRVHWHAAHAQACACRPIPEGIRPDVEELMAIRAERNVNKGGNQCPN